MKKTILNAISKLLIAKQQTVAVAESVTSGLIMATLSGATNATEFFNGGIVAYNLGQKAKHLGIDPIEGQRSNCVSPAVAEEMAIAVSRKFNSDWGSRGHGLCNTRARISNKTVFRLLFV